MVIVMNEKLVHTKSTSPVNLSLEGIPLNLAESELIKDENFSIRYLTFLANNELAAPVDLNIILKRLKSDIESNVPVQDRNIKVFLSTRIIDF